MEVGEDIDAHHTPQFRVFESVFIRPLKGESRGDIRSCV